MSESTSEKLYNVGDSVATRVAYGKALEEFGAKYNIVVLDADLTKSTNTGFFAKAYPERFFNCGIAEGNMASVAAGIATTGETVFYSTFAMFAAGRAYEQVRNSIGYPKLNVKIGATHAGISVGEDGASHQCIEDIALMRVIPGMTVICPADAVEARAAVEAAINYTGPVYLRFGRLNSPVLFDEDSYKFEIGTGIVLSEGSDVTIISMGLMLSKAIEAGKMLAAEGISAKIINMATIKPLDQDLVISSAKQTGAIVTAEEHSVIGGLGSAVADAVTANYPVPVVKIGVQDMFGKSGKPEELLEYFGLTAQAIAEAARVAIQMKNA